MPKINKINEKQIEELKKYRDKNHNKYVEKRLRAVLLRAEGKSNVEIGTLVEAHPTVVSRWICIYVKVGISGLLKGSYGGNHRNMSIDDEREIISKFKEKALNGECVTVKEIKIAYCKKIEHKCGNGQIYRVLERQEWRKIVPRKEHPNKASEAEIEASKKLTFELTN